MSDIKHNHPHVDQNVHVQRPFWTRAHRDWRAWIGVVLMLIAIGYYVMSDEFAWSPRVVTQQPVPGAVGK